MTHHLDLRPLVEKVQQQTRERHDDIVRFMREICAIPSMNSLIGPVGERIQAEMRQLGFDEVRFDKMGNTIGRIGSGPKVLVYDSHIDTVGIGERDEWEWDPFEGKVDPGIRPDFTLIGEPTKMQVYRGHKGRIELKITATGRSAHAASHYLGDNAVYKMMAIITQIRELDRRMRFGMGHHPVQGYPSIAVTDVAARTASLNAVPDQFTIYVDHRITSSKPRDEVVAQITGLIPDYLQDEIHVEELFYDTPSYTGFVFPVSKFYLPWLLADAHPLTQAGQRTRRCGARSGRWARGTSRPTAPTGPARRAFPPSASGRATRPRRT